MAFTITEKNKIAAGFIANRLRPRAVLLLNNRLRLQNAIEEVADDMVGHARLNGSELLAEQWVAELWELEDSEDEREWKRADRCWREIQRLAKKSLRGV